RIADMGRVDGRPTLIAAPNRDQVFGLEDAQGLAQGRAAHLEFGEQVLLARQPVAIAQLATDDALAQHVGDHLGQPRLMDAHARSLTELWAASRRGGPSNDATSK